MKDLFWITLVCLWICRLGATAGENPEKLVSALQKKYESMKDITISFTQNIRNSVTKNEQKISGTMILKKGNKFRIDLQGQSIITDGITTWTYTKATKQVLIDNYRDDGQVTTPDKILTLLPGQFKPEILGKEKIGKVETTVLIMSSKDKNSSIKQMRIWVDDRDTLMRKIQIVDSNENITVYSIDNMKFNSGILDSYFSYIPPKDAEVVDMR